MVASEAILSWAKTIDASRAEETLRRVRSPESAWIRDRDPEVLPTEDLAIAIAVLLATAYPRFAAQVESSPADVRRLLWDGYLAEAGKEAILSRIAARVGDADGERAGSLLRRAVHHERLRIGLREALPLSLGGADIDVTSREHAALAEAAIEVALGEAIRAITKRCGPPIATDGSRARFVVLGMGKLGGEELNAGSDVDLVYVYDTDEGSAIAPSGEATALHDFWTRVARRLTTSLDDVTADGVAFRVDLRLRPEGRSGPIVNSFAATERYYEAFGRLWERAALLRARPVAGDLGFGEEILTALTPFIFRRRVDPRVAIEMIGLVDRARATLRHAVDRDLKLGPGGIREAEFFVQTLMLVWGGHEPRARARNTLDGVRRLRAVGLVTHREAREIIDGYLLLRRAEHFVQTRSGLQTHLVPDDPRDLTALARTLGFPSKEAFSKRLAEARKKVGALFRSLLPTDAPPPSRWLDALAALERSDAAAFQDAIVRAGLGAGAPPGSSDQGDRWIDVAKHLWELARHSDRPLGARSREMYSSLAESLLDAVMDSADPEQAARYLRIFFARLKHPAVYVRFVGDDGRALRRLVEVLGASAFVGEAVTQNPELGDTALFSRGAPLPEEVVRQVRDAIAQANSAPATEGTESGLPDADERLVTAIRRVKARVMIEVGLADLAGETSVRAATATLSALADACLEAAVRHALGVSADEVPRGLAVIAMGKLGGREIGYGSDLDVIFVFDPEALQGSSQDPVLFFTKSARSVIRFISMSHHAGAGYELDTRLRPSGNQGLLVTSIESFARYHRGQAAAWERLALLRARACAGDPELGRRVIDLAHAAAYETPPADPEETRREIHRVRRRMLVELANERRGRHDPKLGRGGLIEVELAVQLKQLERGADPSVRTTDTETAILALAAIGALSEHDASILREGYTFLRKLQERSRIVHAAASQYVEENAPGLQPLARRMGIRDRSGAEAAAELMGRYRAITERVHAVYAALVGA